MKLWPRFGVYEACHWASVCIALLVAAATEAAAEENPQDPEGDGETELTVVPFVGGDNDVGLGLGYIASAARLRPGFEPYSIRMESASLVTFKKSAEGNITLPYVDSYLLLDMPHAIHERLGLEVRLSYTRESTLKYYGVGNASRIPADRDPADSHFEHERMHPTIRVSADYNLSGSVVLDWGMSYTQNWVEVAESSQLARDMQEGSATVRRLLGTPRDHGVLMYSLGLGWDTRDNEVSPQRGQHHTVRADLAPGGYGSIPYRWGRFNAAARFYATLVPDRLVFAVRVLSDLLVGTPPFYELPRYDDTSAIGGTRGVRGIPAQRYYGKIKLVSNTELRSRLFDFELLGKTNSFGVTGFVDTGRLWADYDAHPELDGDSLGIKYGTGAGIRISAGESFVVRLDVAWSPDANPIGAYLSAGHVF